MALQAVLSSAALACSPAARGGLALFVCWPAHEPTPSPWADWPSARPPSAQQDQLVPSCHTRDQRASSDLQPQRPAARRHCLGCAGPCASSAAALELPSSLGAACARDSSAPAGDGPPQQDAPGRMLQWNPLKPVGRVEGDRRPEGGQQHGLVCSSPNQLPDQARADAPPPARLRGVRPQGLPPHSQLSAYSRWHC